MSETCIVRPELIEFAKTEDLFLSIVAHSDGFKFANTTSATNNRDIVDIDFENGANLANAYMHQITAHTLDVETITMRDPTSLMDMAMGDISNVNTVSVSNIDGHGSTKKVRVADATFTYAGQLDPSSDPSHSGAVTVDKVQTNTIEPTLTSGSNHNLVLKARGEDGTIRLERVGGVDPVRITNLATPLLNSDAVNKAYVSGMIERNAQGLSPQEACDFALFGPSHLNAVDPIFATSVNFFITHKHSVVTNGPAGSNIDTSDMYLFVQPTAGDTGNITIDGTLLSKDHLNASKEAELASAPPVRKVRVLISGLQTSGTLTNSLLSEFTDVYGNQRGLANGINNTVGLNGIWEIYEMMNTVTVQSVDYNVIRMKRPPGVNSTSTVINGMYTYITNGAQHSNNAFVVQNSASSIRISETSGLATNENGDTVDVSWVTFNTVGFELDFVTPAGETKEMIDAPTFFEKGGIAMKYDPSNDKRVMVDASKLRFDTDSDTLHTKGNVDFGMTPMDSHINHTIKPGGGGTYSIVVNGSSFHANINESFMDTTYINCHSISCESDETMKKNITPITNGLELVSTLNPVTYNWNRDADEAPVDYGFVAQEVEVVFPSLVNTSHTTGFKGVDYMKFTSILAAAVNELSAKVNELSAKVNELTHTV